MPFYHANRDQNTSDSLVKILKTIQVQPPARIRGVNVSALYPADTNAPLEAMFLSVMQRGFTASHGRPFTTVSDYDAAITANAAPTYWQDFAEGVDQAEPAMGLLRDFAVNPYQAALKKLEASHEEEKEVYGNRLQALRQARVNDIEARTRNRAQEVVATFAPQPQNAPEGSHVFFDYVYHRDYFDAICGANTIAQLATDPAEQDIVRSAYAAFLSGHSHTQMMDWQRRFSGMQDLNQRLETQLAQLTQTTQTQLAQANQRQEAAIAQLTQTMETLITRRLAPLEEAEARRVEAERVEAARVEAERVEAERLTRCDYLGRPLPDVALGHKGVYDMFLRGELQYRPNGDGNNQGLIRLPIADLANPLAGEFDLRNCGDAARYLSINTGYRTAVRPENANKVEIWLAPHFLVAANINGAAKHFQGPVMASWNGSVAPLGMFFTWGGWALDKSMDYVTDKDINFFNKNNVHGLLCAAGTHANHRPRSRAPILQIRASCRRAAWHAKNFVFKF